MRRSFILIALLTLLSSVGFAQGPEIKQLSNKFTVDKKDQNLLKALQIDNKTLEGLRFRLQKQRDIGPLLESLGPGSTGGGDSCFQRIVGNYMRLVTGFKMGLLFNANLETNGYMVSMLENIEIQMGKNLKFKGRPVEALNVPEKNLVIVDRKVCRHQRDYEFDRRMMGLLLHEAYGVATIPDQNYEQSGPLLNQIAEFSEGLGAGDDKKAWLVLNEFSRLLKNKKSEVAKLLSVDPNSSRESVNYKGLKIIKTGEYSEGRAMDYGRSECEPYDKKGRSCSSYWSNTTNYFLVIINKDNRGSGWSETNPFYLEFTVEEAETNVELTGNPEKGEWVKIPEPPPKASFSKILNPG